MAAGRVRPDAGEQAYVCGPAMLPGLVGSVIGYASTGPSQPVHRGLPSGYLTLIFALDGPVVTGSSPEEAHGPRAARNHVLISGLHTAPAYVVAPTGQVGIQLAVSPIASRALFGVPARELAADLTSEGGDVVGNQINHVREQLAEMVLTGAPWSTVFGVLNSYLRRRVERHPPAPVRPEIGAAWRWIARHGGTGSISGLARHVALSPRQLSTVFDRELAVSPKMLSRLLRFHRLIGAMSRSVASGHTPALDDLAYRFGYYDQSHLNRDFRAFTQISPSGWLREERGNIVAGGHRDASAHAADFS